MKQQNTCLDPPLVASIWPEQSSYIVQNVDLLINLHPMENQLDNRHMIPEMLTDETMFAHTCPTTESEPISLVLAYLSTTHI